MHIYYNDYGAQIFSEEEMNATEIENTFHTMERAANRIRKDMERSLKKDNV